MANKRLVSSDILDIKLTNEFLLEDVVFRISNSSKSEVKSSQDSSKPESKPLKTSFKANPKTDPNPILNNSKNLQSKNIINKLFIPLDGSEIRKKWTVKSEKLDKVRSLNGEIINGYHSYSTIAVTEDNHDLFLLENRVFSTKEEDFLSKNKVVLDLIDSTLEGLAKLDHQKVFLMDREFDNQAIIEHISSYESRKIDRLRKLEKPNNLAISNSLNTTISHNSSLNTDSLNTDKSNIDTTISNNSNQNINISNNLNKSSINTSNVNNSNKNISSLNTTKTSSNPKFIIRAKHLNRQFKEGKLSEIKFKKPEVFKIKQLQIKDKKYQNLTLKLSHKNLTLVNKYEEETEITVIQSKLLDKEKKPVFKEDKEFYLLTNQEIKTREDLYQVYLNYFIRWKIEVVFKFLKDVLGLEKFRVEDLKSIKNLISLTFLVGSYLNNLGKVNLSEEFLIWLSKLGDGNGKITPYYLRQGLHVIANYTKVSMLFKQEKIPKEKQKQLVDMMRW